MNLIDDLLIHPPFALDSEQKTKLFFQAMQAAFKHHWTNCKEFRQLCWKQGSDISHPVTDIKNYPYLPAGLFKKKILYLFLLMK